MLSHIEYVCNLLSEYEGILVAGPDLHPFTDASGNRNDGFDMKLIHPRKFELVLEHMISPLERGIYFAAF